MRVFLIALSLLSAASIAEAQRVSDARGGATTPVPALAATSVEPVIVPHAPRSSMYGMGALFAVAGIFGGAHMGSAMACQGASADDWCDLGAGILGATIGEIIMLPIGVHLASDRSSYASKLMVSTGVMAAGIVLAPLTAGISLLAVPPVQLMTVARLEERAIARRHRAPGL